MFVSLTLNEEFFEIFIPISNFYIIYIYSKCFFNNKKKKNKKAAKDLYQLGSYSRSILCLKEFVIIKIKKKNLKFYNLNKSTSLIKYNIL